MQRGVADLGGLQLLVDPQREYARAEADGLEAEVDELAADDLAGAAGAVEPLHVADVGGAHVGLDPGLDGVDLEAEPAQTLGFAGFGGNGDGCGHGGTSRRGAMPEPFELKLFRQSQF